MCLGRLQDSEGDSVVKSCGGRANLASKISSAGDNFVLLLRLDLIA